MLEDGRPRQDHSFVRAEPLLVRGTPSLKRIWGTVLGQADTRNVFPCGFPEAESAMLCIAQASLASALT
jgi:hypothetical protein